MVAGVAVEERIRLLLVEDDPVDRMAFERFVRLGKQPYEYEVASSLAEARRRLEGERFHVILTDYHLGDGTGLELLEEELHAPVVVITGAGDEETAINAMRAGAFDYLIKDTDRGYLKVLPVTVANAHRHHQAEATARTLSQAVKSINDAIFICDIDDRLIFVNETFRKVYGYVEEAILGQSATVLWVRGAEHELPPKALDQLPREGEQGECVHCRQDGEAFSVLLSRSAIYDERGAPMAVVGATRDITERKRREQALRESEERYALAAAGANDGLWDWEVKVGEVHYSPRWKAILGYEDDEIGSTPEDWFDLVHPEDLGLLRAQIDAHLHGKTPHFENEHRIKARGGEYRWVQTRGLAVRDGSDEVYRIAGSHRDITDRKRAEEQLSHAALHDALTGLPNRALFMDRLSHAVQRSGRKSSDEAFGVIFLDLDRFKVVNDSLGHAAGDQLLDAISDRLQSCVRLGDTVARLGGDEFAILVEDLEDERQVDRVAERIQEALLEPFTVSGHEIFTTASLGIALSSTGYDRAEDILRDADTAMYRAKSLGRTRQVVLNPEARTSAVAQLELETELRHAVEREEFEVWYQPIVDLGQGGLTGFEALVRWQHPERGLLEPAEFLPLAIDAGLAQPIVLWVLERACRQLRRWRDVHEGDAEIRLSVNLDAKTLTSARLIDVVERVVEEAELEPSDLRFDVTEGMLMENPEVTTGILRRLRSIGVAIHVDDFGTGYSSLSQLHRFPIDALKIDRSFVGRMSVSREDLEIVTTIVSLARNLGIQVMAEGVETVEQLAQLRTLGCELAQGHLFAEAMPAGRAGRILVEGAPSLPAFVVRPEAEG